MSALSWLALGLGVLLMPLVSPVALRTRVLAERGRLAVGSAQPVGVRRVLRPGPAAVLGCLAATVAVAVLAGAVLGLTTAVASAAVARLVLAALHARTTRRREAELLTALRLLAAELAAGGRPSAAFAAAAEGCPEHRAAFAAAADACLRGDDPPLDAPALAGLAQAWRVAAVTGAPLAAVVGRVADDLAAQAEQRRSVTSAVAGARSSAAMLAGLPLLGLLLGAAMQARPLDVLFGSPSGRLVCLVGVTLDAAGLLWTQWLTARAERT